MDRLKRAAAWAAGSQAGRIRHLSAATGASSSGISTAVLQRKGSYSATQLGDVPPSVLFDELSELNSAVVRYNVAKSTAANEASGAAGPNANVENADENMPNYNLADLERVVAGSRLKIMDLERELLELGATNAIIRRDKIALRQLGSRKRI
ncbi:hypothetical protein BJ742DRAFT_775434 [Cladochytrium replicatum]|nr:hypothetical protein BJ742DRAFT_775434 [Cladochytrium replicatum]